MIQLEAGSPLGQAFLEVLNRGKWVMEHSLVGVLVLTIAKFPLLLQTEQT